MRKIMLVSLAAALALSACGKKPEEPAATNNLVEPPVENVVVEEPDAVPEPSNNAVATPAPAPSVSEQQQIQDDAEASGMTSRMDGEAGQSADEASNSSE